MRMRFLVPGLAVILLAGCGKSDEESKAGKTAPEQSQAAAPTADTANVPADNASKTADQGPESAGEAILTDPDSLPLDEEDDGGDDDTTDPAGNAGAPSPDQTGSINRAAPAAPAE